MRAAFFIFLALIFALPAVAQNRRGAGVRPLDQILPEIRRTHPGQFYDADGPTDAPDGSSHYHLKWMTPDGRIEWLDTDARTGRVLGTSPGRDNFDGPPGPGGMYVPPPGYAPQPRFGYLNDEPRGSRYAGYQLQGYDRGDRGDRQGFQGRDRRERDRR